MKRHARPIRTAWGFVAPRLFYYCFLTPLSFIFDQGIKAHNNFLAKKKI